ncbi:L-asparaginase 1 [Marivivens niveibacter]|uniref:L-asparaginase 1 n=1 Tax=Marivivens niveibacter TaxID=1930667 RepID=A0A251WVT8_9RHOB|nr:asparaginase [Marivivens niveibacter]OUD08589.1 L-asparaginase 1 [Marivivens niveibacter]
MRILVIHTGGTIGMAQTDQGFAPKDGVIEEALDQIRSNHTDLGTIRLMPLTPAIDSGEATTAEWNRIAMAVFTELGNYDAFVITHGTDSLSYSAAAMVMALRGIDVPVILTGSMIPLTVENSDGMRNLTDALIACRSAQPGVWVQFAGRLLHGSRVYKAHSSDLDAFTDSPSEMPPLFASPFPTIAQTSPHKVLTFTIAPGAMFGLLKTAVQQGEALVLRCYGSGTAPNDPELRDALSLAAKRNVPVVAVSQCPAGGMNIGTYQAGQILRDGGVIDGRGMTAEMAHVKLHYALETDDPHAFMATEFCGEM